MSATPSKRGRLARLIVASVAVLACVAAPARAAAPPGFFGTVSITPLDNDDFSRMDNIGSTHTPLPHAVEQHSVHAQRRV